MVYLFPKGRKSEYFNNFQTSLQMLTKEKMENSRLPNISPENRANHPMNGVLIFMEISRSMRTTFFFYKLGVPTCFALW